MARCSVCGSKECCGGEIEQERDQLLARVAELEDFIGLLYGRNYYVAGFHLNGEFEPFDSFVEESEILDCQPQQSLAALEARVLRGAESEFRAMGYPRAADNLKVMADRIEAKAKGDV